MSDTDSGADRCEHEDCDQPLIVEQLDGKIRVDAGSRKRFCSTEHLLASANGKSLDDEGSVIEKDDGPMPSKSGNDVTVTIPLFDCPHCTNESERVARENGEWVHHTCGMEVPDYITETANEELERGNHDRGFVEHEARSLAQTMRPQLEEYGGPDGGADTNQEEHNG